MSEPESPFVGLSAFSAATAAYFTGRERFALTLAGAVLQSRVTVLFGQSGAGKSSVLGAALPDALRAITAPKRRAGLRERQRVAEGAGAGAALEAELPDPPRSAFRLLAFNRWHPGFEDALFADAAAALETTPATPLHQALAGWAGRERAPVVLVLDQFEEFFLYHPRPAEHPLVRELALIAAEHDADLHVLVSLREDSLAQLDRLRAVIPDILAVTVPLRPLDIRAAEEAIRKPVAVWAAQKGVAITVEDALVARLIEQVTVREPARAEAEAAALPLVELPLLQLALERIWREDFRPGGFTLSAATLNRLGGAAGIVRAHLQSTINALTPAQRALVPKLFRFLVTAGGGKQAWRAEDLARELRREAEAEAQARAATGQRAAGPPAADAAGEAEVAGTLQVLASGRARILRTQPDPRGGPPLYELFHDALADPAQKVARDALVAEAQARLAKERRRRRRQLMIAGGVSAAMAFMAAGAAWQWQDAARQKEIAQQATAQAEDALERVGQANERAQQRREEAEEQTRIAQEQEARAVATVARQFSERGDHMTAMAALLEVLPPPFPTRRLRERPVTSGAVMALREAWWHNREQRLLHGMLTPFDDLAVSDNGRFIVGLGSDKAVTVWDVQSQDGRGVEIVPANEPLTSRVTEISRNGRFVLHGGTSRLHAGTTGALSIIDVANRSAAPTIVADAGGVSVAAFSPDGSHVAASEVLSVGDVPAFRARDRVRAWAVQPGAEPAKRLEAEIVGSAARLVFSPSNRLLAALQYNGEVRVWDLDRPAGRPLVLPAAADEQYVVSGSFNKDETLLVLGYSKGLVAVWELQRARSRRDLGQHGTSITEVLVTPDGEAAVVADASGEIRFWSRPGVFRKLEGYAGPMRCLSVSADGGLMLAGNGDVAFTLSLQGAQRTPRRLAGHIVGQPVWLGYGFDAAARPVCARFSAEGRQVVTAERDGHVRIWNIEPQTARSTVAGGTRSEPRLVSISPDGRWLAEFPRSNVMTAPTELLVWAIDGDLAAPRRFPLPQAFIFGSVADVRDGRVRLVSRPQNSTPRIWQWAEEARAFQPLSLGRLALESPVVSPDASHLVGLAAGAVVVVDLARPEAAATLADHPPELTDATFDASCRFLVTIANQQLRVWEKHDAGWRLRATLPDPQAGLPSQSTLDRPTRTPIAITATDRMLLVAAGDTSYILDLTTLDGTPRIMRHPRGWMTAPRLSPDSLYVLARMLGDVPGDGNFRLWNISDDRFDSASLPIPAQDAAFTADGKAIFTVHVDGEVRTWPLPEPAELIRFAHEALTRGLTVNQRITFGLPLPPDAPADRNAAPPPRR